MANPWDVKGAWTPANRQELVDFAAAHGWSEDFERFKDERTVQDWISNWWDPNQRMFKTAKTDPQGNPIAGYVEKPDDVPTGWEAWGQGMARRTGSGGAGAGAGAGAGVGPGAPAATSTPPPTGPAGGASFAGPPPTTPGFSAPPAPTFNYEPFQAPSFEQALSDPGYQFALQQGTDALERSAAAKGVLRTGGTLKDIIGYGQDMAANRYGDVYNRALQGWQANLAAEQAAFAPQYGAWQTEYGGKQGRWQTEAQLPFEAWKTQYGGGLSKWGTEYGGELARWQTQQNAALSKYLQRENNIFGLMNTPPPAAPSY